MSLNLQKIIIVSINNSVYFEVFPNHCFVKNQDTKEIILQGKVKDGLYVFHTMQCSLKPSISNTTFNPTSSTFQLWHSRLGHASSIIVHNVMKLCNVIGHKCDFFCQTCAIAKSHQLPFNDSLTVYTKPLQLVFIGIWGPSPVSSSNGFKYYIAFLNAFSHYTWLYRLHSKSQVMSVFIQFKLYVETQTSHILKSIQTDNAKEFLSLKTYFASHGIHHCLICPHTHDQNGSIECKHRHIANMGLSLLAGASFPHKFWGESFSSVVHIINNLPTSVVLNKSPYETLFLHKPDYNFLKVFGCVCYPLLRPYNQHKFDFCSSLCLFLGNSTRNKGYIVYNLLEKLFYLIMSFLMSTCFLILYLIILFFLLFLQNLLLLLLSLIL